LSFFCFFGRSETGAANPGVGGSTPPLGASKTNGLTPFVFLFLVVFLFFRSFGDGGGKSRRRRFDPAPGGFKNERFSAVRFFISCRFFCFFGRSETGAANPGVVVRLRPFQKRTVCRRSFRVPRRCLGRGFSFVFCSFEAALFDYRRLIPRRPPIFRDASNSRRRRD